MDVRSGRGEATGHGGGQGGPPVFARPTGAERKPLPERIGQVLGEWQAQELRIARGFRECRGLSTEQLEDIYQETALALYSRPYQSEEHLRNALRDGIQKRALRLHRDERRHGEIRAHSAPALRLMAEARAQQTAPEPAVLAKEDRLIALEFKTELTAQEQRVFAWLVEGLQYRAVASVLGIPVNEARSIARSCERKRERFQLFYDTGRLCGYRAQTIMALQNGEATSEVLAERAFAHLDSCGHCRLEHQTNAERLRRSFRDQAAALFPPVFLGHLGWLTRVSLRARLLLHRLGIDTAPLGQGGVRERAAALLAGGASTAKVAAGVVTVAVIAGGTIGATHALDHPNARHQRAHAAQRTTAQAPVPAAIPADLAQAPAALLTGSSTDHAARSQAHPRKASPARSLSSPHRTTPLAAGARREPGGFSYLGVPTSAPASVPASTSEQAHTAAHTSGGQFSP